MHTYLSLLTIEIQTVKKDIEISLGNYTYYNQSMFLKNQILNLKLLAQIQKKKILGLGINFESNFFLKSYTQLLSYRRLL